MLAYLRRHHIGLLDGGADLIIIETAQDILEVKAAVFGAREAFKARSRSVPIHTSVSLLPNGGKMLLGTDISAVLCTLEARYEVALEQYVVKLNIEAETAASIARTMILPAAARHVSELRAAGLDAAVEESEGLLNELWAAIGKLETVNLAENQPDDEALKWAKYMRDKVVPAMAGVRSVADRLEGIVADDLWPLPKYQEMLFIK